MEWEKVKVSAEEKGSFIYFVYPLLFESNKFENLLEAIEIAHLPDRNQSVWKPQAFCQEDLLFNVANYLYSPKVYSPDELSLNCRLWKLNDEVRDTFGLRADWELLSPQNKISFGFGEAGQGNKAIQLALFKIGVGFLIIRTQPKSNDLKDWLNFLHYFRFLKGQQGTGVAAKRKTGLNPETQQPEFSQFFPEPAGGVSQYKNSDRCLFNELIIAFLKTGISEKNPKQWWREVFVPGQMLPFFSLFIKELPTESTPYLLYKLHNFFHTGQGNHPCSEDLQPDNPALLPYITQQWFVFALEGGGFLAVDAPQTDFFKQTLPAHLRDQYFLLFLLALHQKFALIRLSEMVAANWRISDDVETDVQHNTEVFTNIRNQLLLFTARGYFTQVMQREHHHRCYRKWQEVFQLERLYRELNDQVREMHEYSLMQLLRRQDEAAKESDRQRQEDIRRQDEAAKERERLYLQELRAKDEAAQKRDRQLQNTVYIVTAGLGAGAIVASSAGLITQGSSDGQVTIKLPFTSSVLHPFSVAVALSLISALGFGGAVWGARKLIAWYRNKVAQDNLLNFIKLLSERSGWFSIQDRENLGKLIASQPNDAVEIWEALFNWCQDNSHNYPILDELGRLPKSLAKNNFSQTDKNHKKMLLDAIAPPNLAHKKIESFIRLLTTRQELFSDAEQESLRREAPHWPEDVEQLANAIGFWCKVEGRSQIYAELLQLQNSLPSNHLLSNQGKTKDMLLNLLNMKGK
ncbi:hypothetical protein [Argonema antarcticum]|uniref:hypothetical protein n=1 Tax=Argonema antarcticum TaxID=2942763 RepID=UPI00201381D7|nr:hypothetical protein [Argonema antarcticum]MCL1474263.1 hypothetical protein [Argonema antarcticum A004/B2]